MWVYVYTSTRTQLYMHIYAILCNFMHTYTYYTYIYTFAHNYLYMYGGTLTSSRGHNIANICTHTRSHTHTYIYICTGRYVRRRLKGYQVHESAWNLCPVQTQAFKVFFTHALCNQYCMSGLKHSRGARFSNPRVRSWLQRSIRSVWEFSKESLQPIECYCPTPPHP